MGRTLKHLAFIGLILGVGSWVSADIITDTVGEDSADGSLSLTEPGGDGWISGHRGWTHSYDPLPVGSTVNSASIVMDILDGDSGRLDLYAGTDTSGTFIGSSTTVNSSGSPGPWRPLADPLSIDNEYIIPASLFTDLADGTFQVHGQNVSMSIWGSNRAVLTIDFTPVPEPSSLLLLGALSGVLALRPRRRG